MNPKCRAILAVGSAAFAVALLVGCGGNGGLGERFSSPPTGTVVVLGTDTPACGVESFPLIITSANLVAQSGGVSAPLITTTTPATVDFARLTDFTNVVTTANIPPGTYTGLQLNLAGSQLVTLNTGNSPPTPQAVPVTLGSTSLLVPISPALVVASNATTGLTIDFNLLASVQFNASGQATGAVSPQFTLTASGSSSSTLGEASALYGIAGTPSPGNALTGALGSFPLTVDDGTGQIYTVYVNGNTVIEGNGVTSLSQLAANEFVEVDADVSLGGQIVARIVDVEGPTSVANQQSALLGKVVSVTRDSSGNATAFTFLIVDALPVLQGLPAGSGNTGTAGTTLTATLAGTTQYFTNWGTWNQQSFTFGRQTLGVAQNVAVFGTFSTNSPVQFAANQIFLRPQSVAGNYQVLQKVGSDGVTGGFTMNPCGGLFAGRTITALSYPQTVLNGFNGLSYLTSTRSINTVGLLSYQQKDGTASTGGSWIAPTWVVQAREIHQLPF